MDVLDRLKPELREQLSLFSAEWNAFAERYDPNRAPACQKANYTRLVKEIGHLAKSIGHAFSKMGELQRAEPNASEAELLQEILHRYRQFGSDFRKSLVEHGVKPSEIQPLYITIERSVALCESALADAGGPRPRRSFKFELTDLLFTRDRILKQTRHLVSSGPTQRNEDLAVFEQQLVPLIRELYCLPAMAGSGALQYHDVKRKLAQAKNEIETLNPGNEVKAATFVAEKLDEAMALCDRYGGREVSRGAALGS